MGQRDHWRLSYKIRLLGPALACYKERSHPASGQDPSIGGHPTPRALNHPASGCLIYPAHSWLWLFLLRMEGENQGW